MGRFNQGWFKSYREAWDKDLSRNMTLWAIWNALLHMAIWKETQITWEGKQRTLPPGSVIFGITELADRWGCSRSVIKKWLHYLNDTGRIVLETCPRGTIAYLCNWESYQNPDEDTSPQRDHSETSTRHQRDINEPLSKESKKERREEGKKIAAHGLDFEALYQKYPRKEGKSGGLIQCEKQIRTREDYDALSKAIDRYSAHCLKTEQIVMYFSSFLGSDRGKNGHPWRDWLEEGTGQGAEPKGQGTIDFASYIREREAGV